MARAASALIRFLGGGGKNAARRYQAHSAQHTQHKRFHDLSFEDANKKTAGIIANPARYS
jgi:hypothetical protein